MCRHRKQDVAGQQRLSARRNYLAERSAVARCQRPAIAVDLREDWSTPLRRAGLVTAEATAWLAVGLLIYLSEDEAAALLNQVGALSAADSRVAFEVGGLGTDHMRARAGQLPAMQQYVQLWRGGLPDAPSWLAEHDWRPELHDRGSSNRQLRTRAGRLVPRRLRRRNPHLRKRLTRLLMGLRPSRGGQLGSSALSTAVMTCSGSASGLAATERNQLSPSMSARLIQASRIRARAVGGIVADRTPVHHPRDRPVAQLQFGRVDDQVGEPFGDGHVGFDAPGDAGAAPGQQGRGQG